MVTLAEAPMPVHGTSATRGAMASAMCACPVSVLHGEAMPLVVGGLLLPARSPSSFPLMVRGSTSGLSIALAALDALRGCRPQRRNRDASVVVTSELAPLPARARPTSADETLGRVSDLLGLLAAGRPLSAIATSIGQTRQTDDGFVATAIRRV